MIEDKKIEEVTKAYIDKKGYLAKYDEEPCIDIEFAYKEGAKWAINEFLKDLWHTPEEEPKEKDKLLMVETGKKEHKYVHFKRNQGCLFGEWKHYAHMVDVTRWLYMDDLFPKEV